jgi:aromatic ring hydroxylase
MAEKVYVYGERVKDVTSHPAFRNQVRMAARFYDALHDPARRGVLTKPTDTGSAGYTHPFFTTPRGVDDLVADQRAIDRNRPPDEVDDAAARNAVPWHGGALLPNPQYGAAYRWFMQVGYPRIREIVLQNVASGLIYVNSSAEDLGNPEIRAELYLSQLASGQLAGYKRFVDECLAEHDLDGWTAPDLCSFDDLRQLRNGLLNG